MLVSELMSRSPVTVTPEDSAALAARLMARNNVGALPVCTADRRLRGMVTDRDITLRCTASGLVPEETPVREIMSRNITTCSPDEQASLAAGRMAASQVRRLPVVREGKLVGIVSLGDLARRPALDMEAARALADISGFVRTPRPKPGK